MHPFIHTNYPFSLVALLFTDLSERESIYPLIHSLIRLFTHPSTNRSIHSPIHITDNVSIQTNTDNISIQTNTDNYVSVQTNTDNVSIQTNTDNVSIQTNTDKVGGLRPTERLAEEGYNKNTTHKNCV